MAPFAAIVAVVVVAITAAISSSAVDAQDSAQAFAFLDPHNVARAEVGVAPLTWDDTVAAYAQAFATQRKGDCTLVHSGGPYGENLFWGGAGGNWTAASAVSLWVQEKQYYNCSGNSCAAGKVCGHYTQVMWASTARIGCATVSCDDQRGTFVVCNYDPPGNIVGDQPYSCGEFNRSAQDSPEDFLRFQNLYRAGLGVGPLSWSSTLAAYAETYAEKRKEDCHKTPSHGPYGENIFLGAGGSDAWDALNSWIGQKQYYDCSTNSCRSREACGDYTQLAWANSTRVGCASVACDAGGTFIACNYDPPGNVPGQRPYLGCATADINPPDNGNGTIPKVNGDSPSRNSSSQSRDKSNTPTILPIILPVVTVLGLVSAILVCIWRRSRLKRKRSCKFPTSLYFDHVLLQ